MKTYKTIIKITAILAIVLLSLVSFIGIYKVKGYELNNILKDYSVGMEFEGSKEIALNVDTSSETKIYDAEGNVVENKEDGIEYTEENGYKAVEEKVNSDNILTKENFKKVKSIIAQRLNKLNCKQYTIRQDITTGNTIIEIPNDNNSNEIASFATQKGKIEIVDDETNEVLLDNSYISSTKVVYGSTETGTSVYVQIHFNKEGAKKLEEISEVYVETEVNSSEETTEESDATAKEETTKQIKYVRIDFDGTQLLKTYFGEKMTTGMINLSLGESSNAEELQKYMKNAQGMKVILDTGIIPITFNSTVNVVSPEYETIDTRLAICVLSIIFIITLIVLVFKFKGKGIIAIIIEIGYIGALLLLIRFTNVIMTVSGIVGIVIASLLELVFIISLLKNKEKMGWSNLKYVIPKFTLRIIPIILISIIFTFATLINISSFGMTLFWGVILIYIYNLIFANILL